MSTGRTRRLELTERAYEAAKEGRWNTVMDCYRQRGLMLATGDVPAAEAADLRRLDRLVEERTRLTQLALASLMRDAGIIRLRLHTLRHGQGAHSDSTVLRLEA